MPTDCSPFPTLLAQRPSFPLYPLTCSWKCSITSCSGPKASQFFLKSPSGATCPKERSR